MSPVPALPATEPACPGGGRRRRDRSLSRNLAAALDALSAAQLAETLALVGTHTLCDLLAGIGEEMRTRHDQEG